MALPQLAGKAAACIHGRVLLLVGDPPTPARVLSAETAALRAAGLSERKVSYIVDLAPQCFHVAMLSLAHVPREHMSQDGCQLLRLFAGKGVCMLGCRRAAFVTKGRRLIASCLSFLFLQAQHFADGRIREDDLLSLSEEDLIARLTAVRGLGLWSCHMFLMNALCRPDVLPTGDLGIRKGFQKVFGLSKLPSAAQMTSLAEPWRPHRSVACRYMWRAADTKLPTVTDTHTG